MNKKCFKCKKVKPLSDFYKHKEMVGGHLGKCKSCTKKDVTKRYNDPISREKIREYERKRCADKNRKLKVAEYQKRKRLTFKGKFRARNAVNNALRDGRIVKKPCEICGCHNSEAHHYDYRKFLDIKWLCFKHHREQHGQKII